MKHRPTSAMQAHVLYLPQENWLVGALGGLPKTTNKT